MALYHEMLLALLGHTGEIIVPVAGDNHARQRVDAVGAVPPSAASASASGGAAAAGAEGAGAAAILPSASRASAGAYMVSPDLDFVPVAERQLINEVVQLGCYYSRIQRFIERHQRLGLGSSASTMLNARSQLARRRRKRRLRRKARLAKLAVAASSTGSKAGSIASNGPSAWDIKTLGSSIGSGGGGGGAEPEERKQGGPHAATAAAAAAAAAADYDEQEDSGDLLDEIEFEGHLEDESDEDSLIASASLSSLHTKSSLSNAIMSNRSGGPRGPGGPGDGSDDDDDNDDDDDDDVDDDEPRGPGNEQVRIGAPSYEGATPGLYIRALCTGLAEMLDGYRICVLQAERDILEGTQAQLDNQTATTSSPTSFVTSSNSSGFVSVTSAFPLSKFRSHFSQYEVVLRALDDLIAEILMSNAGTNVGIHGGQVLSLLHRHSQSGRPAIQQVMRRLLFSCHRVFFNQLTAWLVHGSLTDPFDEFFIQRASLSSEDAGDAISSAPPHTEYTVRVSMMPVAYLPVAVAKQILFVGRGVCILLSHAEQQRQQHSEHLQQQQRHSTENTVGDKSGWGDLISFDSQNNVSHSLRYIAEASSLSTELSGEEVKLESNDGIIGGGGGGDGDSSMQLAVPGKVSQDTPVVSDRVSLVPVDELQAFAALLNDLKERPVFELGALRAALSDIHKVVTARLWQLLVEQGDLLGHFRALKDFFLVSRGEFFQSFIDESQALFSRPPSNRAEYDVQVGPFHSAAVQCRLQHEEGFKRLSVRMDRTTFSIPKFSRGNLTDKSGDQISLLGASRLSCSSIRMTPAICNRVGAMWASPRKIVDRGFSSSFIFRAQCRPHAKQMQVLKSDIEGQRVGFAFVVQNTGPVLAARTRLNLGANAPPEMEQPLFDSLDNAVSIQFVARDSVLRSAPDVYMAVFVHANIAPARRGTTLLRRRLAMDSAAGTRCIASKLVSAKDLGITSVSSNSLGARSRSVTPSLFDGKHHAIKVVYETSPDKLLVYVDGGSHPVVEADVGIRRELLLEGGRAWVGFVSGTHNDQRLRPWSPLISSWSFEQLQRDVSVDAWRNLHLNYRVSGPTSLILRPESQDRYNALFRFLFAVKRVQVALQHTWGPQMVYRKIGSAPAQLQPCLMPMMSLRANMAFLIDNLQFYLHVDVIEVEFAQLLRTVDACKQYESVRQAHEDFLTELCTRCFLRDRVVYSALSDLFETCLDYCSMLQVRMPHVQLENIQSFTSEFERQACFLFTVISRKSNLQSSTYLTQLATRLDYNRWWSTLASRIGMRQPVGSAGNTV